MERITDKNGDKFIKLTKKEFYDNYIVGCLWKYSSSGGDESEVLIKLYGEVPDLNYCVIKKGQERR